MKNLTIDRVLSATRKLSRDGVRGSLGLLPRTRLRDNCLKPHLRVGRFLSEWALEEILGRRGMLGELLREREFSLPIIQRRVKRDESYREPDSAVVSATGLPPSSNCPSAPYDDLLNPRRPRPRNNDGHRQPILARPEHDLADFFLARLEGMHAAAVV